MIKVLLFGLFLILNQNKELSEKTNSYFDELKSSTFLNEKEYLIILFTSLNECLNCQEMILKSFDCISQRMKEKVKIIGIIRANRKKEICKIKDRLIWNYQILFDDGTAKSKLYLQENSQIALFKSDGNCILALDVNEVKKVQLCNYLIEKITNNPN